MLSLKIISVVSIYPGSGQTTISVNLACGLSRAGNRVLIASMNDNKKLAIWLGIDDAKDMPGHKDIKISRMGLDVLNLNLADESSVSVIEFLSDLKQFDYDYLLLLPAAKSDFSWLNELSDYLIVCTDLSHADEVADIISLEKSLTESQKSSISLIVPNKINTKEWDHNSQQLFSLAEYFGYEKIADPIPYCERIHDLPLGGRTVWELSQQNLQAAFMSLVEAVKAL